MRWAVHSEKPLYTDPWLDIRIADVELPDGRHLDFESSRIEWVDMRTIPDLIGRSEITSGTTLAALLYTITQDS